MRSICVDAGFLIGLYDESDEHHKKATEYFLEFFDLAQNRLLVAWPILYETVSTRMVRKNTKRIARLEQDWKRLSMQSRLHLLSDAEFREEAIDECFKELGKPRQQYRDLSLVDRVLRKILSEQNLRIHAFVTFNPRDFHDVCSRFGRELLC